MSVNSVTLIGRLTKDIEMRQTSSGKSVASFTLAVDRIPTLKEQSADFFMVTVWDKQAENMERYCHKGSLIAVQGRLHSGSYENKQGEKVYYVDVTASYVQFLDTKKDSQQQVNQPRSENLGAQSSFNQQRGQTHHNDFSDHYVANSGSQQGQEKQAGFSDPFGAGSAGNSEGLNVNYSDLPF